MALVSVNTKARPLGTVRPPAHDLDVGSLILHVPYGIGAEVRRLASGIELVQTIEGASTLTLKVRDYLRTLLRSDLTGEDSRVTVDNIEYALAKVSHNENEITLIFEELAVHLLRGYDEPKKAARDNVTRAQFVRGMVAEVKERNIPFSCPEETEKQPIDASEPAPATSTDPAAGTPAPADSGAAAAGGGLTVKRKAATAHQLEMGKLIVETTRGRGGDAESCAGAVATAIQESNMTNMSGGDRDSQGLYQQRPSMGWGTVAQIRTPSYAIGKFLDQYLPYRSQGLGWLQASHKTQRSAHPSAPAPWYGEGQAFTARFTGSGGGGAASDFISGGDGMTAEQPYEFSRGDANKKENSWDCAGRLADEVKWRRFMRTGAFWYVSDNWLMKQPVSYRFSERTAGVVALTFDFETRKPAQEASLRVVARRYSILPGDIVELIEEGPGDGKWLVREVRRVMTSQVADVSLTRPTPKLPEPAATRTTVGDRTQAGEGGALSGDTASRAYQAAEEATRMNWSYSQPQRNRQDSGYADCSSGVSWVLQRAGIPLPGPMKPNAPVSGAYLSWGQAGEGERMTVYTNAGHIWIRWNNVGAAWRFDTGGGSGGKNWPTPRSTGGFVARHWAGT